jgi:hypothetical protein
VLLDAQKRACLRKSDLHAGPETACRATLRHGLDLGPACGCKVEFPHCPHSPRPRSLFIDRPARVCALQTLVRDWEGRFMLSTPLIYNICSPDPSEGHPFLFLTPTGLLLDGDDAFVVLKLCFFYSFPRLLLATYLLFRRSSSGRRDRTCT